MSVLLFCFRFTNIYIIIYISSGKTANQGDAMIYIIFYFIQSIVKSRLVGFIYIPYIVTSSLLLPVLSIKNDYEKQLKQLTGNMSFGTILFINFLKTGFVINRFIKFRQNSHALKWIYLLLIIICSSLNYVSVCPLLFSFFFLTSIQAT